MPIVGLTDSTRPTLLGMIRIGEKKVSQNGKEYPSKLDHFIFDPKDPENAESILAQAVAIYGDKPKSLRVKFHSDNFSDIFDANYCLWQASGLLCKGDGKTALRLDDRFVQMREERAPKTPTDPRDIIDDEELEGETFTRVVCNTPGMCPYAIARGAFGKPGCSAKGFLRVILPDMPGLGVWGLSTGSINSIAQLNSAVQYLYGAFGGRLFGREANLIITPKQGIIPDTQKRTTIYVLNLTTEQSFNQLAQLAAQAPALPAPGMALGHEYLDGDDDDLVDPETGEVFEAAISRQPAAQPARRAEPVLDVQLEDDPEILCAMATAGFSPAKKMGMLASAAENRWTRDHLLDLIAKQTPAQTQAPARAAAPVAARTAAPTGNGGARTKPLI